MSVNIVKLAQAAVGNKLTVRLAMTPQTPIRYVPLMFTNPLTRASKVCYIDVQMNDSATSVEVDRCAQQALSTLL